MTKYGFLTPTRPHGRSWGGGGCEHLYLYLYLYLLNIYSTYNGNVQYNVYKMYKIYSNTSYLTSMLTYSVMFFVQNYMAGFRAAVHAGSHPSTGDPKTEAV